MSSTTILNEILQKLSTLSAEDEIKEQEVQEEVVEAASEATEEVKEETTELSDEVAEAPVEEVEASAEEVEAQKETEESLEAGYVSEEKYQQDMAALMAEIEAIKKKIDEEMGYMVKEKEALSEQVKELSKEPAAEAIKHNPEGEAPKKFNFTYGQNKPQNTFDRVMARISNKQ
jgi:DNA repair exonuclease SbcCD ATPase subunit